MDLECARLLPHVCAILVDKRAIMTDESIYQKLLDWFRVLVTTVPPDNLLEENQCILGLLEHVLNMGSSDINLFAFALRLTGLLAGYVDGFIFLEHGEIISDFFGIYTVEGAMWDTANVRLAWIDGIRDMLKHRAAFVRLQTIGLRVLLNLQSDASTCVYIAANDLMAHLIIASTQVQENVDVEDRLALPDVAWYFTNHIEQMIIEDTQVADRCIRTATVLFRDCPDGLASIVWETIYGPVKSFVKSKLNVYSEEFAEMLIAVVRFPFTDPAARKLWHVVSVALQNLDPPHAVCLASEILKLSHCPVELQPQAISVFLQPFNYIVNQHYPESVDNHANIRRDFEVFMNRKHSCIELLCVCLRCLRELVELRELDSQIPQSFLLHSILCLLAFCIGKRMYRGPLIRSKFRKNTIGCSKVQKMALDTLRSLSSWELQKGSLLGIFNALYCYTQESDADATILKKTLQTSLTWLQVSSLPENGEFWPDCVYFLKALSPQLMKLLCKPSWEFRDTSLEFITDLVPLLKERDGYLDALCSTPIPVLVVDMLRDQESYVRASVVNCLGQLVTIDDLYQTVIRNCGQPVEALKRETLVPVFLNILSEDTEYFPRRGVMKAFIEWLRLGHFQNFRTFEDLLARILNLTKEDSDWEVKLHAIELISVFVDQTLDACVPPSCPDTAGLPVNENVCGKTGAMQKFNAAGLFPFLLDALSGCYRMVALKACQILILLKSKLGDGEETSTRPEGSKLKGLEWLEERMTNWRKGGAGASDAPDKHWSDLLNKMDLANLEIALSKDSSIRNHTPQSLLLDIRTALWGELEQDADCY